MKNLYVFSLLSILSIAALASEGKSESTTKNVNVTIEGTVLDVESGEALVGVAITLNDKTVYTDFDGMFRISNIQQGTYEILTSYIAYEDKTVKVTTDNHEELKIGLKSE